MNDDHDNTTLIEIYKLHAELAERVATSREGLNKLYTGMVSTIVVASVLLQRFDPESQTTWILPGLGCIVSISWLISLTSMTGRLTAKNVVLISLETRLSFDFFKRENVEFEKRGFIRRKWSSVLMPILFLLIHVGWLASVLW